MLNLQKDLQRQSLREQAYIKAQKEQQEQQMWEEEQKRMFRKPAKIQAYFQDVLIMDHDRITVDMLPF